MQKWNIDFLSVSAKCKNWFTLQSYCLDMLALFEALQLNRRHVPPVCLQKLELTLQPRLNFAFISYSTSDFLQNQSKLVLALCALVNHSLTPEQTLF
jgi:hypothetical protein